MHLRKLDLSLAKDINKFIQFPFSLYKNNSQWVPPLDSDMRLVMNRQQHPFFRHSEADFFVAENKAGEVCGRIAVLHNRNYCEYHKTPVAFFYYFESLDSHEIAGRLFEAAFEWARQRKLTAILGPRGFTRSSGAGLLVEGFDFPPAMGILYNYPYYNSLITGCGFEKETDYLSGYLEKSHRLPEKLYRVAEKVKARNRFWIKTFRDKNEMRQWVPKIDQVHHQAFCNNPGYYPSTHEEFELIANSMIEIADPKLIKVIMKDEEVAGFILAYADISKALQKTKGKLWPFGWLTLLLEKSSTRVVDLNGVGLLPQFQGSGANALLYVELEKTLRGFQFEHAEFVQVDERNFKSKSDSETIGVIMHKRHRLYRRSLQ